MDNSLLSLNNEARAVHKINNSEVEDPRKDIILHNLGIGFKKLIVAEDDRLNVRSFENKDVSLHYLARKLVLMFLWSKERTGE